MSDGNLDDFGNVEIKTSRVSECVEGEDEVGAYKNETTFVKVEDISDKSKDDYVQWAIGPNNTFVPTQNTTKKIPAGYYTTRYTPNIGCFLCKQNLNTDDLLYFPDSELQEIIDQTDYFWSDEVSEKFKKHGFLRKRGYMFYGAAGTGKTCLVHLIMQHLIKKFDGVVISGKSPHRLQQILINFRKIEPQRKIMGLFEDIDAIIAEHGDSELLSLLDGEDSIDNILFIATTNYPEKLDRRIIGRPRRFDILKKIDYPNTENRKIFFKEKLKITGKELKKYIDATQNFTFAAMAELVICTACLGLNFDEAVTRLKNLTKNTIPSSNEYYSSNRAGFSDDEEK